MQNKIDQAKAIIRMVAKHYKKPVVFTGFGKDSICNLHLCRSLGFNWPVIFYRDMFFPQKYRYANKMICDWNLACYDYPPRTTGLFYRNGIFEIVKGYSIGFATLSFCAALYRPEFYIEGEYLCAYQDLYLQPTCQNYDFRWDVGIMGFRYTESKPHSAGQSSELSWVNKHNIGSCDTVFPIRDWTNQEVYQYIVENGIPINTDVYEVKDGELVPKINPRTGEIDSTYNPDRRPACYECMIPENPKTVLCPKKMCSVNNISRTVRWAEMPNDFPGSRRKPQIKED
jgi:3'-phosphoadenosine 5'-phosphosulfate sulfotransferase (PAPS reductase)/FAD synthetase